MLAAADLVITEFMASNSDTLADGDGQFSDWIEVYNADTVPVDLADYFLTDTDGDLTRWAFPQYPLLPDEYLVVFASSPVDAMGIPLDDYVDGGGNLHTNFSAGSGGEYLAITYRDPSTQLVSVVHAYAPEYPAQYSDISYGIASDASLGYFDTPTPGAPNGLGLSGVVADTTFSVDRGFYDTPFQVEIATETLLAEIYYTTNGSAPDPITGTLYTGPLTIDHTTVLRAAAFRDGFLPTNVDTQTYLFLNDVVQQDQQSVLDMGYPSTWSDFSTTVEADYGLDPDVIGTFDNDGSSLGGDIFGGIYAATIKDDLLSLPTISIVSEIDNLFGTFGILSMPRSNFEYPASVEWISPDGGAQFQIDAGLQAQGGAFRTHQLTRKHSMRLVFKGEYGASELEFPLFGEDAVDHFNTLVLRAGANDGYSWRSARLTEQYIRDEFGRSLLRATGRPSAQGNFAHLYVNGIYWGLYNPVERPDDFFAASYLGGEPESWDTVHDNEFPTGDGQAWLAMLAKSAEAGSSLAAYMELQGKNPDGSTSNTVAPLLNVENYVDYIAINVWGGNWDWPWKNFRAARNRNEDLTTGFEFFNWDFENTMGNNRSRSPLDATVLDQDFFGNDNAGQAHTSLSQNPEYRLLFADHVHKLFFNDGILTPAKLAERYQQLADQIERAIVAESARWGDMHWPIPLTLAEWTTERDWILNTYFPQRAGIVLEELKSYDLYPETVAPVFNQHGGVVPAGFDLTITAPSGTIWYTLDGSDPRELGGAINPNAIEHDGSAIDIPAGVSVRARVLENGEWSALNEAEFVVLPTGDVSKLRIAELHYHPASAEELEFIELLNTDTDTISLDGVQIGSFAAEPYQFAEGQTLAAGARLVVARNPAVFQSFYGNEIPLALTGYADANLSNGGESISLLGPAGQLLQHFTYDDYADFGWPSAADGGGPSLEYVGPFDAGENPLDGSPADPFDNPANWRASLADGGSPGTDGAALPNSADFDGDGFVSGFDFLLWQQNVPIASGATKAQGDADNDGMVGPEDLVIWEQLYSTAAPLVAALQPLATVASAEPPAPDNQEALAAWTLSQQLAATNSQPAESDAVLSEETADLFYSADAPVITDPVAAETAEDEVFRSWSSDEESSEELFAALGREFE